MGLWEVFRQQTLVIYSSVIIIYKFGSVHYVFASITEKVKSLMKSQSNKSMLILGNLTKHNSLGINHLMWLLSCT